MITYEPYPPEMRTAMAAHGRLIQGAIAMIAHEVMGKQIAEPEGIGKYEGGVIVNGREIAIKHGYVTDDWNRQREATPEETAVVHAIAQVRQMWEIGEHTEQGGATMLSRFKPARVGDPLRQLLDLKSRVQTAE
jgi:hypothetical protein